MALQLFFEQLDPSVWKAHGGDGDFEQAKLRCKQYLQEKGISKAEQLLSSDIMLVLDFGSMCSSVEINIRALWTKLEDFHNNYTLLEDTLDGEIIGGGDEELVVIKDRYIPHCHRAELRSASKQASPNASRNMKVIMVHGPSGSGKTFFAVKECPSRNLSASNTKVCTLYLKEDGAFNWEAFESIVLDEITEHLNKKRKSSNMTITRQLDMRLAVVIDEVYGIGHYLGTKQNLQRLLDCMKRIATDYLLVVAGTGLDHVSGGYATEHDVLKYDMKPWNETQVRQVAKRLELETEWVALIKGRGSLRALFSNARSAYFLLSEVKQCSLRGSKDLKRTDKESERRMDEALDSYVPQLLDCVINTYIGHNGLMRLDKYARRLVGGAVLKELHDSRRSTEPRWPTFDMLRLTPVGFDKDRLERMAFALIDMHVEKHQRNGSEMVTFVSGEAPSSVSVTPAMCMILYELLGVKLSIHHGWSDFELIGAVYALCEELFACESLEDLMKWRIVAVGEAFPSTAGWETVEMPLYGNFTVWRNGEKAPFADVIAPYKLYQLKFTTSTSYEVSINLFEEVGKVGMLRDEEGIMSTEDYRRFHKGEVLLSALYKQWGDESNESDVLEDARGIDVARPNLSCLYPEILLIGRKTVRHQIKVRSFEVDVKETEEAEDEFLKRYRSSKKTWRDVNGAVLPIVDGFEGERKKPVNLIFVTNAEKVRLSFSKKGSCAKKDSIVLTADDVNEDGCLKESALQRKAPFKISGKRGRSSVSSSLTMPVAKVSRNEASLSEEVDMDETPRSVFSCAIPQESVGTWLKDKQERFFKDGILMRFVFG